MSKATDLALGWLRALFVCVAIPAMWAMEMWIGFMLVRAPQEIDRDAVSTLGFIPDSAFSVALGLCVIWIMYKTPFLAISLAFDPPHTEGGAQQ